MDGPQGGPILDYRRGTRNAGGWRFDTPARASLVLATLFWCDDKPPAEIRKACLRGAKVNGTDFYLVDLRSARYDKEQAQHFGACGAILVSRAS